MRGGSIASNSVAQLVNNATVLKLNAQFDNQVGGKGKKTKTGKAVKTVKTVKAVKTAKTAKTAQTAKTVKPKKGGMCLMCGGQKGGASPQFQIQYDYSGAMQQKPHGIPIHRAINDTSVSMLASESPSVLGGLNKTVQFGNVTGTSRVPFTYGGAAPAKVSKKSPKQSKK